MQLFVRASRTLVLELDPADAAVHHVKRQVHEILGVPPCEQRLVHAGKQLEDWRALDECGVASGSTVHLLLRVRGGCPPDRCCCWDLHTGTHRAWSVSRPLQRPPSRWSALTLAPPPAVRTQG